MKNNIKWRNSTHWRNQVTSTATWMMELFYLPGILHVLFNYFAFLRKDRAHLHKWNPLARPLLRIARAFERKVLLLSFLYPFFSATSHNLDFLLLATSTIRHISISKFSQNTHWHIPSEYAHSGLFCSQRINDPKNRLKKEEKRK